MPTITTKDGTEIYYQYRGSEDLKRIEIPALVMHGDGDQIVPIAAAALLSAELRERATLKIYQRLPHGICTPNPELININNDLLPFFKGAAASAAAAVL